MRSLFPIVISTDAVFPTNFMDHFFDNFMKPFEGSCSIPKVDIEDKGNEYVLTTDLPGVSKEDISLTYDHDVLTLSAHHEAEQDKQDEQKHYLYKERSSSTFCRSFPVSGIRKEDIQASFADGVLTITLPKEDVKPAVEATTIDIQ